MKTVIVKFPVEKEKPLQGVKSQVYDFLAGAISLGDLPLERKDLLQLTFNIPVSNEEYDFEGETFNVYDVEVTGEGRVVDIIEKWQDGFTQALN